MNARQKAAAILLIIFLLFGYALLFFKRYPGKAVLNGADCIVVIDVKGIRNTVLWEAIKHPGKWNAGKLFSGRSKSDSSLLSMFELPDYLCPFHMPGEKFSTWHLILGKKSEKGFRNGLAFLGFEKFGQDQYANRSASLHLQVIKDKVLLTYGHTEHNDTASLAEKMFSAQAFASHEMLGKPIRSGSHLACFIPANHFLKEDALLTANLESDKLTVNGKFRLRSPVSLANASFTFSPASFFSAGMSHSAYGLFTDSAKAKLGTLLNSEPDSVFLSSNQTYQLDFTGWRQRIDSAVSYSYDEDFNVRNDTVMNMVTEPSFLFSVRGPEISRIYQYRLERGLIDSPDSMPVFIQVPFVRTNIFIEGNNLLKIISTNYSPAVPVAPVNALLAVQLNTNAIPAYIQPYIPELFQRVFRNVGSVAIDISAVDDAIFLKAIALKKDSSSSIIN